MRHHRNFAVHSKNDVLACSEKIALSQAVGIWVNESGLGYAPTANICTSQAQKKPRLMRNNGQRFTTSYI